MPVSSTRAPENGRKAMLIETPSMDARRLFVALKVAEVCNLACGYCYFFEKKDQSYRTAPAYINDEVLAETGRFLGVGAAQLGIPVVSVALHGGEPLMLGKERLVRACHILRREIEPHAELNLGIQTNGVLLDREWIEMLSATNVGLSVSLDGPKSVHDAARPDKRGRGSYDAVLAAIRLLQDAEKRGDIPSFGVLAVIDPNRSAAEYYDFFIRELGLRNLFIRPPAMSWETRDRDAVERVNRFLEELFTIWAAEDDPRIDIRTNVQAFRSFLHDAATTERVSHIVDLAQAISIRSNGDVCPDDSLPPLLPRYRDLGYNVRSHTLAEFYEDPVWYEINGSLVGPKNECGECSWFGICGGGEISNRFSEGSLFAKKSIYCDGYKALHKAAYDYVSRSIGAGGVLERLRLSQIAIASLTQ